MILGTSHLRPSWCGPAAWLAILAPDKFAAPHDEAPRNIVAMGQPVTVMFSFGLHGSALNKRHVHHAAQY